MVETRRAFLTRLPIRVGAIVGTGAVLNSIRGCSPLPNEVNQNIGDLLVEEESSVIGGADNKLGWSDPSLTDSAIQGSLYAVAEYLPVSLFNNMSSKIKLGNSLAESDFENKINRMHPLVGLADKFFIKGLLFPLGEEGIFRLLPSAFFAKEPGYNWKVGVVTSGIFAVYHNFTESGFHSEYITLPQFVGGLFFWKIFREKGFEHSAVAHMSHNLTDFALGGIQSFFEGDR